MLCPDCKRPAAGGSPCPQCGRQVPEMEIFGGQGSHYLYVLAGFSALLFAVLFVAAGEFLGWEAVRSSFARSSWFWTCVLIALLPLGMGVRYWALLREEELVLTDTYIARRSHWGAERLEWSQVAAFRRQPILFRQTTLGRIAGLSLLLTRRRLLVKLPPMRYELIARDPDEPQLRAMRLDPGTVSDMDWLLQLIQERLGPPEWI